MKDGNKTIKGDRQIISVSIPLPVANRLNWFIERYSMNRSDLISQAIKFYLDTLGIKEGNNNG